MIKELFDTSEIFTRGIEDIITRDELNVRLHSKKQLRIKLGIDATAPDLHIGHAVNLWKIRTLQEAGHKAVIILGDFTTRIGDPTGKSATRPHLEPAVIKKNIMALRRQVERILLTSPKLYEVRKNSEWFGSMRVQEFLSFTSMITHARLIERDMFQQRIQGGKEITISEMLYPILQGYDSVAIQSDMTIIGSDQLFNEHMGRLFQERFRQRPQVIITNKLLPGLGGGEKMSKSLGNYIGLTDSPKDKFGKAMRVHDDLIIPYMEVYTDIPMHDIAGLTEDLKRGKNPMDVKLSLAYAIVKRYHGADVARREREVFLNIFSKGNIPIDMPTKKLNEGLWSMVDVLVKTELAPSKSEARRLLAQGAVSLDENIISDHKHNIMIKKGSILRVGKRRFIKII